MTHHSVLPLTLHKESAENPRADFIFPLHTTSRYVFVKRGFIYYKSIIKGAKDQESTSSDTNGENCYRTTRNGERFSKDDHCQNEKQQEEHHHRNFKVGGVALCNRVHFVTEGSHVDQA